MADLTKEYFNRDLTEAEEESLAREIATSPDAAMRLAESARLSYEATGLPMPSEPKAPGSSNFHGVPFDVAVLLIGLGVFLAVIAFVIWHCVVSASGPDSTVPVDGSAFAPPPVAAPVQKKTIVRPASSFITPLPASEGDKFEALDILVRRASAGAVTVRVVDATGKIVRNLYAGTVAGGLWRFPWNGCRDGGMTADAGTYRIEVGTSSGVQRRTVLLKSETSTPGPN